MADITAIPGIADLRRHTRGGDPRVCVAVLDGPVDLDHPCFAGADLTPLATLASGRATGGGMSRHGTHVASVIFGRYDGPVPGLAPGCRGLIVPIFADEEGHLSQLDLARAIDQAVEAGAHVSGGRRVPTSEAEDLLGRAIRHARDRNMLIVAAAGNDGCACLHVPARGGVTAVGCLGHF
jgi:subtilisin family serine protease